MKQRHLFTLLDKTFTTVKVQFSGISPDEAKRKYATNPFSDSGQRWTYKVPLSWNVQQGDSLVVLTSRDGLKIVNVVSVDEVPDIDVDADFTYAWAVQKVDMSEFRDLTIKERLFGETMLQVERERQREALLDSWRNSLPEGSAARALFEQTAASLMPPPAPQEPPVSSVGQDAAGFTGGNS